MNSPFYFSFLAYDSLLFGSVKSCYFLPITFSLSHSPSRHHPSGGDLLLNDLHQLPVVRNTVLLVDHAPGLPVQTSRLVPY